MFLCKLVLRLVALPAALLLTAACQNEALPQPTLAPTISPTPSQAPSPTLSATPPEPAPPIRPMLTATPPARPTVQVNVVPPTPTPQAPCLVARPGDTLYGLLARSGLYREASPALLAAMRELNGLPVGSNNIQAGNTYCIPLPTATPTPLGYEATQTVVARELPDLAQRIFAEATYIVREGENITTVQLNSGATLREICAMNPPTVINCTGCDLTKPIGAQGCRPIVVVGQALKVPGPTPTPTITPTRSGLETATPTPPYGAPRIVSPAQGAVVSGIAQLIWLPVALLQPDEFYLIVWSDMTRQQTWQHATRATTFRLPIALAPPSGAAHLINWQIGVAREQADGSYLIISPWSAIHSFTWQGE
ncbi:MAG: LysM peptidoglycan-binding domain-containing protein [Chloroflexota bacterium]|nr:MAG: LysM peptidoglycan-binding domain-containing protein [Chloroflexota bacterium]